MAKDTRAKFGYLTESDMRIKIADGILDAYDICYTKDTNLCYMINDNLEPKMMRSRVYCYNSVSDAVIDINKNQDTYEGQIISVLYNDIYRAYIVQRNDYSWYISPVARLASEIDFNELGNRPITNLQGTILSPIIIDMLQDGIYAITGQYKIYNDSITIFSSAGTYMFIKDGTDITQYLAGDIVKYTDGNVTSPERYVTDKDLQSYATIKYVNDYLKEIKAVTEDNVEEVVTNIISDSMETVVENYIDGTLATQEDVENLF